MDPDACLKEILTALAEGTPALGARARDHATEGLTDLAEWIERGGAYPKVEHAYMSDEGHGKALIEHLTPDAKVWVIGQDRLE